MQTMRLAVRCRLTSRFTRRNRTPLVTVLCTRGMSSSGEKPLKEAILDGALTHVGEHGWSVDAIAQSCQDEGLSVASAGMFPGGAGDLVEHFLVKCNRDLNDKLGGPIEGEHTAEDVTECLGGAVRARLEMVLPYIDTWPQAMAIAALPPNSVRTLQLHAELMDLIWTHTGDDSRSAEWFSRRVALGAVYAATELHLLTDSTPQQEATWSFLNGRLQEASFVGTQLRDVERNVNVLGGIASATIQAAYLSAARNAGGEAVNPDDSATFDFSGDEADRPEWDRSDRKDDSSDSNSKTQ